MDALTFADTIVLTWMELRAVVPDLWVHFVERGKRDVVLLDQGLARCPNVRTDGCFAG